MNVAETGLHVEIAVDAEGEGVIAVYEDTILDRAFALTVDQKTGRVAALFKVGDVTKSRDCGQVSSRMKKRLNLFGRLLWQRIEGETLKPATQIRLINLNRT